MSIAPERQAVSLHTHSGIQLYQYIPENTAALTWSRDLREVSRSTLKLPADDHLQRLDIVPWQHWASIWDIDGDQLLWTGPIQRATLNRESLQLTATDCAAFAGRTRVPITKRWEATDPAHIAAELWNAMIENHNLNVQPIIRPDPEGEPFDFAVEADSSLMSDVISKLVGLGLRWTVVAGIPILGPVSRKPVWSLSQDDFLGQGLQLTRDGALSANDILLRAGDAKVRARVPMADLNLQTIVDVDDIFGPGNAERATLEYARHYASIRDSVTVPGGTELHPAANVRVEELIPSARGTVDAYGQLTLLELESVDVAITGEGCTTSVSMEAVVELPELADLSGVGGETQ